NSFLVEKVTGFGTADEATGAQLRDLTNVQAFAIAPDGTFYVIRGLKIYKSNQQGVLQHFAGGDYCPDANAGDEGPAVLACISFYASAMALGPDGSLYIMERGTYRIRRVTPDGIIHRVA